MAPLMRKRVRVHGRVQGVFFRDSTRQKARQVGVRGWVRNRSDGSVEAVFEGTPEQVVELVRFCHDGPTWARVERVEEFEEAAEGLADFRVT